MGKQAESVGVHELRVINRASTVLNFPREIGCPTELATESTATRGLDVIKT